MEADRIEASRPKSEVELYRAAIAKASTGTTTKADDGRGRERCCCATMTAHPHHDFVT